MGIKLGRHRTRSSYDRSRRLELDNGCGNVAPLIKGPSTSASASAELCRPAISRGKTAVLPLPIHEATAHFERPRQCPPMGSQCQCTVLPSAGDWALHSNCCMLWRLPKRARTWLLPLLPPGQATNNCPSSSHAIRPSPPRGGGACSRYIHVQRYQGGTGNYQLEAIIPRC